MTLAVQDDLASSGLLQFLLPRFSFKSNVGIDVEVRAAPGEAVPEPDEFRIVATGEGAAATSAPSGVLRREAFSRRDATGEIVYHAVFRETGATEQVATFVEWLFSDVGRRTVASYRPGDVQLYFPPAEEVREVVEEALPGDAAMGERLALTHCGRCHVINESNRMAGLGSTPSFGALRANRNWQERFESFFARNPHPSFTQIDGITEPFDISRPPPIVPLELTLEDLEAILAYVSRIEPADLGAPVRMQ